MNSLKFSVGNAKLKKDTLIFDLPAGKVCPGALNCHSWVNVDKDGKRSIKDGKFTEFRCYAASQEVLYTALYQKRQYNLNLILEALKEDKDKNTLFCTVSLILRSIEKYETKNIKKVRIHSSGDFFNMAYLDAWLAVAKVKHNLKFYFYSKSLNLFLNKPLPKNVYLTASFGGLYDHLIKDNFKRYAVVVYSKSEAYTLGLLHHGKGYKIDKDDSSCFKNAPFALLLHGSQPKGSTASKALQVIKKEKLLSKSSI